MLIEPQGNKLPTSRQPLARYDYLVTNCQALLADPREFDRPR